MKKSILVFGLISGAISSLLMTGSMLFADRIGFDHSYFLGYTIIVLSFLLVFFGIRSYRDNLSNGQITFGKGFTIGICITLISCVCYIVAWEILYFFFLPDFMEKYSAHILQKMQAAGATAAEIQAKVQQLKEYKQLYDNPLTNAAVTFLEPFPVGLVITLISAGILRRKPQPKSSQASVAAT